MTSREKYSKSEKGKETKRKKCLEFRKKKKKNINSLKTECKFCGEYDKSCLDFHHIDPGTKEFSVANASHFKSIENINKEISKCITLCSNCHRKFHGKDGPPSVQDHFPIQSYVSLV